MRLWRWKTMVSRGGMVDMPRPRQELQISATTGQRRVPLPQEWEQVMQAALGDLRSEVAFGLEVILMDVRCMDFGAYEARRRWLVGGGRRRLEWLRRWEVDEGREADSGGRWRVARVMNVRRPEHRHVANSSRCRWSGQEWTRCQGLPGAWSGWRLLGAQETCERRRVGWRRLCTRRLEGRRRLRAAGRAQGCSAAAGEAQTGGTAAVAMMGRRRERWRRCGL